MVHRTLKGSIAYTSKKPEMMDKARGYEHFTFTHHGDGQTSLRAHCFIAEPSPSVMRDIIYSLDKDRRPMDCHVRLTVGDTFMGSGWFRFGDGFIECESYGPNIGRVSQRVDIKAPIDGFGTHPIVADGYFLGLFDWSVTKRRTFNMYLPSPDHRGATPPFLSPVRIDGLYLGEEEITVQAGTFKTRHFQFLDDGTSGMSGEHPVYDVWITADEDAIFVQGGVGGYMKTWYELVSLERG
jgi:hypothetical protein